MQYRLQAFESIKLRSKRKLDHLKYPLATFFEDTNTLAMEKDHFDARNTFRKFENNDES